MFHRPQGQTEEQGMQSTNLTENQIEAINLLKAAAAWLAGEGPKPETNNCDAVVLVVEALSSCGVK